MKAGAGSDCVRRRCTLFAARSSSCCGGGDEIHTKIPGFWFERSKGLIDCHAWSKSYFASLRLLFFLFFPNDGMKNMANASESRVQVVFHLLQSPCKWHARGQRLVHPLVHPRTRSGDPLLVPHLSSPSFPDSLVQMRHGIRGKRTAMTFSYSLFSFLPEEPRGNRSFPSGTRR